MVKYEYFTILVCLQNIKYNYNYSFGSLGCQRDYWNSEGVSFPSISEHQPKKRMKFGKFT